MEFTPLNTFFGAVAPLLGTGGPLMYFGWKRRRRQQQFAEALQHAGARRKQVLEKAGELRIPTDAWFRERGDGQIAWLFVGGYGTSQAPYILSACERAGTQGYVGGIYILDFDHDKLEKCWEAIPPVFHSRITIATCENLWAGIGGGTVQKARALKPLWWHDVVDGTAQWLSQMQHDTKPVMLQSIVSAAGMAALAEPVIQQFQARYPHLPIYQTTVLDAKSVVRHRYPDVRALFSQHNRERGHVVIDNLRAFRRNDFGLALLPAAMLAAPAISQQPLEMWNALAYLFPEEQPGGYATVSVWAEPIPVFYDEGFADAIPPIYYTIQAQVEEKIIRGVMELVEHPELQSVPLPAAPLGRTRHIYVIAPLKHAYFKRIAARVDENLEEWRAQTDPDLLIHYASIAAPMNPETRDTPLVLVMLQPLADTGKELDEFARNGYASEQRVLSGASRNKALGAKP